MRFLGIEDMEQAHHACKAGVGAAAFVAVVTVVVVLASLTGVQAVPGETVSLLALIDAILFSAVAWGVSRHSRFAAVAGVALYVFEKVSMPLPSNPMAFLFVLVVGGCLVYGAVGAFAYHRLSRGEKAPVPA